MDDIASFKGKRVLLLQGPLGPFFNRLAGDLEQAGATVRKINFNGGDWVFFPKRSIAFRGGLQEWPLFLQRILSEHAIDVVLLFGDCRPIHRVARKVAVRMGVEIGVFEEGYIRPDYVTLERHGVNGHSRIPRSPLFYLSLPPSSVPSTKKVGYMFAHACAWAIVYYAASALLWPLFRRYRHHRPLGVAEALPWIKSAWRKVRFSVKEQEVQLRLTSELSKRFFLVPLQVHNDAQIHVHSRYKSVEEFITHVMASFARHSPPDTFLVIKHHPMDRGYHDYTKLIQEYAGQYRISERILYIHDQHLPSLLDHARGVTLINSTVGLSALHHGTPLKVCGKALYDLEGLTYQGTLDEFWGKAGAMSVNKHLYQLFIGYLIEHTQLNGSFYRRLKLRGSRAGLVWPQPWMAAPTQEVILEETDIAASN